MSRRQSLDRPGILSPPGPFLTPSPSPSISASPRLQPSPSLSPFPQDVLLVTGNTITNTTQEQERKAATPGRRQSLHQYNGSPNAGTVVFQPSPSQSPAAATTIIGVTPNVTTTGNEFNTTLVGSNNIQLNKKGNKRTNVQQQQQQQYQQHQIFSTIPANVVSTPICSIASGYGQQQATAFNATNTLTTTNVACSPKGQTKKGFGATGTTIFSSTQFNQTPQQQQQHFQQYHSSSPLIADSPVPSPSGTITSATIKPTTPQPVQMLQQQFTITTGNAPQHQQHNQQQVYQFIQGPQGQIIAAPAQHSQHRFISGNGNTTTSISSSHNISSTTTSSNSSNSSPTATTNKSTTKVPQQILPKPQLHSNESSSLQLSSATSQKAKNHQSNMQMPQISQSPQPQVVTATNSNQQQQQQQQQQIILPPNATTSLTATATQQPLLLNQMPVLVQQNTPQGVQLILRPPTPQLTATPSLVIQNARPQQQLHHAHSHQQQHPQQLLRILNTNGATMQLAAATPTFIVSSQANIIQQTANLQTIKTQPQTNTASMTQLSGLHAALSAAAAANQPRSQQFTTATAATINSHLLGQSVAAQLQNLQLAAAANAAGGSIAQIQMPNGLSATPGTTILSQLPAHFQQSLSTTGGGLINLQHLNQLSGASIQQLAAAAAAAAGVNHFQTSTPQTTTTTMATDLFNAAAAAAAAQHITQSSPAHMPAVAVTPEPLRQGTPVLHQQQQFLSNGTTIINTGGTNTISYQQHLQSAAQPMQQPVAELTKPAKKPAKPRKKKQPAAVAAATAVVANATNKSGIVQTAVSNYNSSINNIIVPTPHLPPTTNSNLQLTQQQQQFSQQQQNSQMELNINATSSAGVTTTAVATATTTVYSSQQSVAATAARAKSPSPTPQITRASNGKLDLGNVMKLCGIMEDDDDDDDFSMELAPPSATLQQAEESSQSQQPTQLLVSNNSNSSSTNPAPTIQSHSNDIMISIPSQAGGESIPFTFTIPANASTAASSSGSAAATLTENDEPQNILIKIDQNDVAAPPYTISIPRLPTAEEIHQQAQQHLAQQAAAAAAAAAHQHTMATSNTTTKCSTSLSNSQLPTISFSLPTSATTTTTITTPLLPQQQHTQNLQSTPTNTSTYGTSNVANTSNTTMATVANNNTVILANQVTATTSSTATTTTAAVKPRRKPAVRRNGKKQDLIAPSNNFTMTSATPAVTTTPMPTNAIINSIATSISTTATSMAPTTTSQVPSQIGNIQISQVDATKLQNQSSLPTLINNTVENKIQIMPILDNAGVKIGSHTVNSSSNSNTNQFQQQMQTTASLPTQVFHSQPLQQQQQHSQQQQHLPQTDTTTTTTYRLTSDGRQMQLSSVITPQLSTTTPTAVPQLQQVPATMNSNNNLMAPSSTQQLTGMPANVSISVGSPATASALIPQLTGSLTLAVSEQCERLILRHDPNQPQDQQSQLILQALLKGALPNLTIINEPTKLDIAATNKQQFQPQQLFQHQQQQSQPQQQLLNGPRTNFIAASTGAIKKQTNSTGTTLSTKSPATMQLQLNQSAPNLQQQQLDQSNARRLVPETKNTKSEFLPVATTTSQLQQSFPMQQHQFSQLQQKNPTISGATTPTLISTQQQASQQQQHQQQQQHMQLQQQRYVALPKIDPTTQQLFCLNTINNQITPISSTQTTASIVPTERLLIAPAGINAQQLAQCLSQGQIHFNDVNPLPPTPTASQPVMGSMISTQVSAPQPPSFSTATAAPTVTRTQVTAPQQQIVYPQPVVQPLIGGNSCSLPSSAASATTTTTITKQVANVAPIIDQSKAKLEPASRAPKKKPVRKPKTTTTAADVASSTAGMPKNASVVKPMPKLDPLSQKPNNNPVQIVQPNVISGKQIVASSTSNSITTTTTTTSSNSIQPFQSLQQATSGTKLIGITAPMQQQPQQQLQQQQIVQQQNYQQLQQNILQAQTRINADNSMQTHVNNSNNITSTTSNISLQNSGSNNTTPQLQLSVGGPPILSAISASTTMQQQQQPQQHTVSRVQTIQLTPQQQQMFKQVQLQIQYLTAKLQNKSLMLPLTLPPDFDASAIAMFNKPMTDAEINEALQRLFSEQQRILAAGKEIPTPEGYMPTPNGNVGFTLLQHQPQQIQQQHDLAKAANIPANIVQPNNHSTTLSTNMSNLQQQQQQQQLQQNVPHRIHIYPMQHHQNSLQNKQKQLQQQTNKQQLQQQQLSNSQQQSKAKETAAKIKLIAAAQQQQHQTIVTNSMLQIKQQQQQQQQQQQIKQQQTNQIQATITTQQQQQQQLMQLQQQHQVKNLQFSTFPNNNGPPPLVLSSSSSITATATLQAAPAMTISQASNSIQTHQQHNFNQIATSLSSSISASNLFASPSVPVTAAGSVVSPLPTTLGTQIVSAAISTTTSINITKPTTPLASNFKLEESYSPKPKLARLSLFVRQLEVDQQSCLKPDYINPFQNKEEAVKRLVRYHCMYENDEEIPSDEDEEFERTAFKFQEKFQTLSGKFQEILLQESTLQHRTSELCQMQKLMIDDLKCEIEDLRNIDFNNLQEQQLLEKQNFESEILKDEFSKAIKMELPETVLNEDNDPIIVHNGQKADTDMQLAQEQPQCDSKVNFDNKQFDKKTTHIKNEIKTEPTDQPTNNSITKENIEAVADGAPEATIDKFDLLKNNNNEFNNSIISKQEHIKFNQQQQQLVAATVTKQQQQQFGKNEKFNNWSSFNNVTDVKSSFYAQTKQFNGALKNNVIIGASNFVKKEYDNFDIESEITPSFIMKKIENKDNSVTVSNAISTTVPTLVPNKPHKRVHNEKTVSIAANVLEQLTPTLPTSSQQQHQTPILSSNSSNAFELNDFKLRQQKQSNTQPANQNQNQSQDDDWFCLQKELNYLNDTKIEHQALSNSSKTPLDIFENANSPRVPMNAASGTSSHSNISDLFPNGCISNKQSSNNNSSTANISSCSQQRQQPLHHLQQHHVTASISELFDPETTDVNKSVETRLDAMFGESPVLDKNNSDDTHDIVESGLDEIFGDAKSPTEPGSSAISTTNVAATKRIWQQQEIDASNFLRSTAASTSRGIFESEQQQFQQQHHIQLSCNSNPRWMQTMEAQLHEFMSSSSSASNNGMAPTNQIAIAAADSRKRQWNGELLSPSDLDDESNSKKMCTSSSSTTTSSSSPPLSRQHQVSSQQHHDIMDADLLSSLHDGMGVDTATAVHSTGTGGPGGFPQMLLQQQQQQQQQTQFATSQQQQFNSLLVDGNAIDHHQTHFAQNHMSSHMEQQQQQHHHHHNHHIHMHHGGGNNIANLSVGSGSGGEFDDDISRHVQNAIDSILNLQNSESDSLNFSLDHSMGSFLGDSMLDDRQQLTASSSNNPTQLTSCQEHIAVEPSSRRHLVDELDDCLISGTTANVVDAAGNILLATDEHQPQQQLHNHHMLNHNHHQQQQTNVAATSVNLNDFNCAAANIDEAVKSIMTS